MKGIKYIALLRGINVGGNNIIKMNELKILFEEMGFEKVTTYIQSGNVMFEDAEKDKSELAKKIEKDLSDRMSAQIKVVMLTFFDIQRVIDEKPDKFGEENDRCKYNVLFLAAPLKSEEAVRKIKAREGVDAVCGGPNVVYFSYLISKRTKSYISKLNESEIYSELTIRNWNTTEALYRLMSADRSPSESLAEDSE